MTISDRIFETLKQKNMSQKEFSERTGIAQSTISEWKSKRTNPTSEKLMSICNVLGVSLGWLLSGSEKSGKRGNELDWFIIDRESELGFLVQSYNRMDKAQQDRLLGYIEAIAGMGSKSG